MEIKFLFCLLNGDGSGDYVMAIKNNPEGVARAVSGMPSVRGIERVSKRVTHVIFKGRLDEPLGMFRIIKSRVRSTR